MDSNVVLTRHGQKRAKQRLGLNSRAAQRIATKAYQDGLTREEVGGKLKKFIDFQDDFHKKMDGSVNHRNPSYDVRVYHGAIYVFAEDKTLVTVYAVPTKFAQRAQQIERRAKTQRTQTVST